MDQSPKATLPKLDAPGAGLPQIEHIVAGASFFVYRTLRNREYASQHFRSEAELIIDSLKSISEQRGSAQVLTARVFGIEDSSRFWSPFMVLDHLIIVDSAIIKVIEALASGRLDLREAKIADVKPSPDSTSEVVEKFRVVIEDYETRLTKISDLKTSLKHAHPWFGPLNAHGWHCLAALHHSIHKRQLAAILATGA